MKNGYSIYEGSTKFEIILDGIETVSLTLGDITDPEHEWAMEVPFDDFRDYLKTLVGQFDLEG